MMKIAFCDDSPDVLRGLDAFMLADKQEICADWRLFPSGQALLTHLEKEGQSYDLYVLDIEMPELSGIDTARKIRANDKNALIIFLTGFREYVYQVFEVLPFRFLQKPVSPAALARALEEATAHIKQAGALFFFQAGREQMQRPLGEITCFEGAGRKVLLHTPDETLSFYGKLGEILGRLDSQLFTRPHASYLVNMEFIRRVRQNEIILSGNLTIPISRRFQAAFKQDYMNFVGRRSGML